MRRLLQLYTEVAQGPHHGGGRAQMAYLLHPREGHEAEGKWLEPLPTRSSAEGTHRRRECLGSGSGSGEVEQSRQEDR